LISHFFCYSYGDPRDLHSFPTRRSSDLGRKEIDLVVEAPVDDYRDLPGESVWPSVFDRLLELIREHTSTIVFVNNRRLAERIAEDRKSTRLNSSHRTISYAVFCLKKKKK